MSDAYRPQGNAQNSTDGDASLADKAKSIGRDFKEQASGLSDSVARTARDQASGIADAAKDFASTATGKVSSALNDQKAAGADYIGSIAQAVKRAAGEFEGDVPQAATYIRQTADRIDNVASAVRDRDMRELVGEVKDFARRQPTLFFGGAMVLGFAALRFFKSTANDGGARSSQNYAGDGSQAPQNQSYTRHQAS
jgi:hypothetical protein